MISLSCSKTTTCRLADPVLDAETLPIQNRWQRHLYRPKPVFTNSICFYRAALIELRYPPPEINA